MIFSGTLLSAKEPFSGNVKIGVPLVETLPGAPYVSVLHLHAASFPFAAIFAFSDGTTTSASTTVRCPPGAQARRAGAQAHRAGSRARRAAALSGRGR